MYLEHNREKDEMRSAYLYLGITIRATLVLARL